MLKESVQARILLILKLWKEVSCFPSMEVDETAIKVWSEIIFR